MKTTRMPAKSVRVRVVANRAKNRPDRTSDAARGTTPTAYPSNQSNEAKTWSWSSAGLLAVGAGEFGLLLVETLVRRLVTRQPEVTPVVVVVDAPAWYVFTKLEPPLVSVSPESDVSIEPRPAAMFIALACQCPLSIGPVYPSIVAVALVNVTELKFANGSTPWFDDGASTIHSADDALRAGLRFALW